MYTLILKEDDKKLYSVHGAGVYGVVTSMIHYIQQKYSIKF